MGIMETKTTRKRKMTEEQVVKLIRRQQGKKSLRDFAESLGINYSYLSLIYNGERSPGDKVLSFFGITKTLADNPEYEHVASGRIMTREEVLAMIRARQGDQRQSDYASEIGIGNTYLSDIYNRRRDPGEAVLQFFGIRQTRRRVALYEK